MFVTEYIHIHADYFFWSHIGKNNTIVPFQIHSLKFILNNNLIYLIHFKELNLF